MLIVLKTNTQPIDDPDRACLLPSDITHHGYHKFDFNLQYDYQRKVYILQVGVEGEGQAQISATMADSFPCCGLYGNQITQETHLGFRYVY